MLAYVNRAECIYQAQKSRFKGNSKKVLGFHQEVFIHDIKM